MFGVNEVSLFFFESQIRKSQNLYLNPNKWVLLLLLLFVESQFLSILFGIQ